MTATYSGFVNGDSAAVLSGGPGLATRAGLPAPGPLPHRRGAGALTDVNYTFPFVNGTLTVNPADTGTALAVSAATPLAGVDP